MSRLLTDLEWNDLTKKFPLLKRENAKVIDDSGNIGNYNCYAWVLDCTDKRLAPPLGINAFKDWFADRGYSSWQPSSDKAGIDGWGQNGVMQHASRLWNGSWTSKLDNGLCITHGRDELTGTSEIPAYGRILVSFSHFRDKNRRNPIADFLHHFLPKR
jgi:hypothetical protein